MLFRRYEVFDSENNEVVGRYWTKGEFGARGHAADFNYYAREMKRFVVRKRSL